MKDHIQLDAAEQSRLAMLSRQLVFNPSKSSEIVSKFILNTDKPEYLSVCTELSLLSSLENTENLWVTISTMLNSVEHPVRYAGRVLRWAYFKELHRGVKPSLSFKEMFYKKT